MPRSTLDPHILSDAAHDSVSPRSSTTPLLASTQHQDLSDEEKSSPIVRNSPNSAKRRLFRFGKKDPKDHNSDDPPSGEVSDLPSHPIPAAPSMASSSSSAPGQPALQPAAAILKKDRSLESGAQPIPISPRNALHQNAIAASPSRLRSSSPRLHSPASSEIFERNVQEPVPIASDQSTAHIPAHVMTEDHIPPALEASAQAITSQNLGPDEVEIVTSSTHQPAAASVLEGSASNSELTQFQSPIPLRHEKSEDSGPTSLLQHSGFIQPPGSEDDGASNYGQLDPTDVRRLSFISFADVVQSEHQFPTSAPALGDTGSADGLHIGSLSSSMQERAASPFRSPRSPASLQSSGLATPPSQGGINLNTVNIEQSPARSAHLGSPVAGQYGELAIETMRQAVRKTASGDLGQVRSPALSPISSQDDALRESSRGVTRNRGDT